MRPARNRVKGRTTATQRGCQYSIVSCLIAAYRCICCVMYFSDVFIFFGACVCLTFCCFGGLARPDSTLIHAMYYGHGTSMQYGHGTCMYHYCGHNTCIQRGDSICNDCNHGTRSIYGTTCLMSYTVIGRSLGRYKLPTTESHGVARKVCAVNDIN